MATSAEALRPEVARISLRANWWIAIPITALIAAIQSDGLWLLYYVHIFSAILWTGTDIFMGFILGPIMRRVDVPTRRAITLRLAPRMLFYMPTVATVTTTAGYYLGQRYGLFQLSYPDAYWVLAAVALVVVMTVQGFGILLPTNLRVFFEMRKEKPDAAKSAG